MLPDIDSLALFVRAAELRSLSKAAEGELLPVRDGRVPVPQGAGLGAAPDLDMLARSLPHLGREDGMTK